MKEMGQPFELTLKHYNTTILIKKDRSDLNLNEVMEMVEQLLLAAGFSKQSIDDYFNKC